MDQDKREEDTNETKLVAPNSISKGRRLIYGLWFGLMGACVIAILIPMISLIISSEVENYGKVSPYGGALAIILIVNMFLMSYEKNRKDKSK